MTHIETLKSQLKELEEQKEAFNRESFELKLKRKFNKTKISLIQNEIKLLSNGDKEEAKTVG